MKPPSTPLAVAVMALAAALIVGSGWIDNHQQNTAILANQADGKRFREELRQRLALTEQTNAMTRELCEHFGLRVPASQP